MWIPDGQDRISNEGDNVAIRKSIETLRFRTAMRRQRLSIQ